MSELNLLNRVGTEAKTPLPTKQENTAFQNVTGIMKPIPHDQAETDRKISEVIKRQHQLDEKNAKLRDVETGENTPRAIANRQKLEHYRLKQDAKNAAVRLNAYGVPDVHHWQGEVDKWLKAKKAAEVEGSLGNERQAERELVKAEEQLLEAQQRLERYRSENTRAVGLLKSWEAENLPAKKS
jgi:capsule polysaccharide export protein KpsE/RkpR